MIKALVKPLAKCGRLDLDADINLIGAVGTLRKRWALEEAERAWALSEGDPRRPGVFHSGDAVVFTACFLQSVNAALDIASVFTVQECSCELCALGDYVCTTEWLAAYDSWRHLHKANIRHKGALHANDLPPGMWKPIVMPRIAPVAPPAKCRR